MKWCGIVTVSVPKKDLQTQAPEGDMRIRPHGLGDHWGKEDGKTLERDLNSVYSLELRVTI